jgi:hypothetical protein
MSLSDLTDLYYRIQQYILNQGFAPRSVGDYSGFNLFSDGFEVQIADWSYDAPEPVFSDLDGIDYSQIIRYQNEQQQKGKVRELGFLSDATLLEMANNGQARHGMFCYAVDRNSLTIYNNPSGTGVGDWMLIGAWPSMPQTITYDSRDP